MTKVSINLRKSLLSEEFIKQARLFMVQWKNAGGTKTKNIKNILLPMPVLRTCRQHGGMFDFKPQLESDTPPSCRRSLKDRWHRQKDKNRSPSAKHTTLLPLQNTHHVPTVEVIISHILVGFFAVKRRAVFVLGVVWVSPRKRVTVGLCGLRHGNEFPLTILPQCIIYGP